MLFDRTRIGKMVLENRLVMPPLETNFANDDGAVSQRTLDYYERRARGGPGLIVVECTSVDPVHFHRNQLNISDDRFIGGLSRLAEIIKRHGVRAAIQVQHPGRQIVLPSVQSVAPSPLACRAIPRVPRELTIAEIEELVERFAEAVRRARDAGFNAVQFHGAHGYLIAQFMSAWSNKRTDRYGGDVYGRANFPLEIIARTREKVGADYPLIFRFSGDEYVPGGRGIDESKVVAQLVEEAGIDAISVSAGTYDSGEWTSQPMLMPRGCLVPLAAEIKSVVGVGGRDKERRRCAGSDGRPDSQSAVGRGNPATGQGRPGRDGPTAVRRPRPAEEGQRGQRARNLPLHLVQHLYAKSLHWTGHMPHESGLGTRRYSRGENTPAEAGTCGQRRPGRH